MISLKYVLSAPKNLGAGAPSAMRSMGLMVIMLSSKMFSKKAKLLLRRGAPAPHVMRKHNVLRLL